jgi:hypothetical protein
MQCDSCVIHTVMLADTAASAQPAALPAYQYGAVCQYVQQHVWCHDHHVSSSHLTRPAAVEGLATIVAAAAAWQEQSWHGRGQG